ncbi:C3a anaphylatoxin chemotactic receptor-like [Entelurus aequoreus]|uniref:C3a anaphylatoxin chemotactic receptor-like n=1 Tax=Entelurus aequoreus TaxID=161455 RepID=UPI002B1D3B50|nr:C3a anaphylatoxin chemotactic receptor-like [Entelurus aequoreus]XP_061903437.1 C3a anaphylatoxin chemotactic receptor-like [Entelurus aequoreus]XP_061903438.1 C3a anaphylatoxin chemotactic receptor-like [Entelurus aequoreus]
MMHPGASGSLAFLNSSLTGLPAKAGGGGSNMDILSIVLYMLTILLGIPGNAIVIWVAGVKLKPNVLNVWLVNLAIADQIFCLTRIFSLVKKLFLDHWPFGVFICKFNGFFKYANMFGSVFLLAVISVDRALCIWRPVFTRRHRTLWAAKVVAVCVWATAVVFSSPYFFYRQVYADAKNLSKCSVEEVGNKDARMVLYFIRFLCGFLVPFLVILSCYILAGQGIRRTRLSGKTLPLRILAMLVTAFFLCWAPYHILLLLRMKEKSNPIVKFWLPAAKAVAYFNSCVNPLLYFFVGLKLRGRSRQSLEGVYRNALTEDVDGQTVQSKEDSVEPRGVSEC